MILELATNKSSANFFVILVLSLSLFLINALANNFGTVEILISSATFLGIIFLTYKLSIYFDAKPGEDLLAPYILTFLSLGFHINVIGILGDFFAILGLIFTFKTLDNEKQIKNSQIANIAFIFALSSVFQPLYIFLIFFLGLIVILYFPKISHLISIVLIFLATYYIAFSLLYLLKILSLKEIIHYFDISFSFNIAVIDNMLIFIIIITLLLIISFIHISANFFKFSVRLRHTFVALYLFLLFVTFLSIISAKLLYTQLVSISLLLSFWLLNTNAKTYIKDSVLILIIGLSLLMLF